MSAKQSSRPIAVLGSGTMGHGIAQIAAMAGYSVHLYDPDSSALTRALSRVEKMLDKGVQRGKVSEETREKALAHIDTTSDLLTAVADAEFVVEAVPERMDLKVKLFRELVTLAPDDAILGTNTSSLSVTEIAASVETSSRVIGMHFFNPPAVMKLMEVIRAEQTSDDTLARTQAFGERLGREMIVVQDTAGFATSRLGLVIGLEAMRMLEEGVASAEDIDRAMTLGYRHPMGPLRLTDLVGLDVRLAIAEHLTNELGERFRPPSILRRLVRAGHLGQKTGRGFYDWSKS